MSTVNFASAVYAEMRAHGEQAYPQECCGVLLGVPSAVGWSILTSVRADNAQADSAQTRYRISPVELLKIERAARDGGLNIAGFYHSHPDRPAHWSQTDLAEAHWPGCSYVVTAVEDGRATATHSFFLAGSAVDGKHFETQQIVVA